MFFSMRWASFWAIEYKKKNKDDFVLHGLHATQAHPKIVKIVLLTRPLCHFATHQACVLLWKSLPASVVSFNSKTWYSVKSQHSNIVALNSYYYLLQARASSFKNWWIYIYIWFVVFPEHPFFCHSIELLTSSADSTPIIMHTSKTQRRERIEETKQRTKKT